jgi:hypothetical protein
MFFLIHQPDAVRMTGKWRFPRWKADTATRA